MTSATHWQLTWADRENERRRRAYRSDSVAWLRRQDHLTRLRIEAAEFLGCTQPRTGLAVDLDDDELVFRVLPVASLVEVQARHVLGLPTPGPSDFADTPNDALPDGLRIVDTGMAVVTSRRVAFAGRDHRREWRYADLLGAAHHPDVPLTLLHTTDHGRLTGLRVPAAAAVNARFYLALAVAIFDGSRAAVVAQLDALLAAHRGDRPVPVAVVSPDEAPTTAVRPDRRAVAVAAVAATMFATLTAGAFGPESGSSVGRAEAGTINAVDAVTPSRLDERERGTSTAGDAAVRATSGVLSGGAAVRPVVPSSSPVPMIAPVPPAVRVPPAGPVPSVAPGVPSAPAPSATSTPRPRPAPTTPPPSASASPTAPASPTATPSPSPDSTALSACLGPFQLPVPCP
ncbi:hypothetical protein V6V47_08970 [Micromonospora sp. CPCC 205539]|uniref:hypothetical protein n=1 Tax=Micromonospora sp. CPCC 205539 TaxID=3122408 RepID=UPI002FF0708F